MQRMKQEYKRAMQLGQLSKEVYTEREWTTINHWVNNSQNVGAKLRSNKYVKKIFPYIPYSVKKVLYRIYEILLKVLKKK